MWTRIGAAIILFGGLVSVMVQLIILQATPAIGVAFGDCIVGAIGDARPQCTLHPSAHALLQVCLRHHT